MAINEPPTGPASHAAASLGWECPRCHATYAPWMATCAECKPPADALRDRLYPQAPTTPAIPHVPPQPYPVTPWVWPPPQWPYQDRIIWCGPVNTTFTLTPEARARMTMCSGAGSAQTWTVNLGTNYQPNERNDEGDDGIAGVPART